MDIRQCLLIQMHTLSPLRRCWQAPNNEVSFFIWGNFWLEPQGTCLTLNRENHRVVPLQNCIGSKSSQYFRFPQPLFVSDQITTLLSQCKRGFTQPKKCSRTKIYAIVFFVLREINSFNLITVHHIIHWFLVNTHISIHATHRLSPNICSKYYVPLDIALISVYDVELYAICSYCFICAYHPGTFENHARISPIGLAMSLSTPASSPGSSLHLLDW